MDIIRPSKHRHPKRGRSSEDSRLYRMIEARRAGKYKNDLGFDDVAPNNLPDTAQTASAMLAEFGYDERDEIAFLQRRFNGDTNYCAGVIQAAYHLLLFHGLRGDGKSTSPQLKDIFMDVANLVHRHGTPHADSLIDSIGFENIDMALIRAPLPSGNKISVTPVGDLERITGTSTTIIPPPKAVYRGPITIYF